jgi:hypothetical protein
MRVWAEAAYGIPPYQVIGSSNAAKFDTTLNPPTIMKLAEFSFNDDKLAKPVGIHQHIGKRPVFTGGNSDGDYGMMLYTSTGSGPRFGLYVHHTDSLREYFYDRQPGLARLNSGLDDAAKYNWLIVDMQKDWKNQLFVGFNNGPQYNLDEIVRFDAATATANSINIRPDIWLLPFLNVYAILGKAKTSTAIDAGIYVADFNNNWTKITSFSTKANFDATSFGLGLTPTIGVGGGFLALDMNMTWTDISALDKPVFTFIFGPRLGKTFQFKKPDQNIAFWVGGFRVGLSSSTSGSLKLGDVISTVGLQAKVDQSMQNVAQKQTGVDNWWNGLSNIEQKNPVNIAKYETANRALDAAGNLLTAVDGALNTAETSTVQYSLQKNLKDKWNFLIGSQVQMNKHFMIRAEYGFLGSRQQFLAGLQYRFGL